MERVNLTDSKVMKHAQKAKCFLNLFLYCVKILISLSIFLKKIYSFHPTHRWFNCKIHVKHEEYGNF